MADISVTAANVLPGTSAITKTGTAGATITAGQSVYLDSATSTYKLADSNGATAAIAAVAGIALNGARSGQRIDIQTGGNITAGGTVAIGVVYCQSTNAGGICPSTDVTAGQYVTVIGVGTTTANLKMNILQSGIAKA